MNALIQSRRKWEAASYFLISAECIDDPKVKAEYRQRAKELKQEADLWWERAVRESEPSYVS